MQVFLPYNNILKIANCLDKKRLNKQIIECKQIIKAIKGETKTWANHPICKMYKDDLDFLGMYLGVLGLYQKLTKTEHGIDVIYYMLEYNNPSYLKTLCSTFNIDDELTKEFINLYDLNILANSSIPKL